MSGKKRRLGIFGGSFDPPHGGHLHAARAAREAFELDQVLFIPAARPPHKPGRSLAPGQQRLALLELLIAPEPDFRVDGRELERAGPSYTVTTLEELSSPATQELFMIIGTDNLAGLPAWRQVEAALKLAQPIVILRAGDPARSLQELQGKLSQEALGALRAGFLELPTVDISSTELRRRLRAGEDPGGLLPAELQDHIARHGLYREGP